MAIVRDINNYDNYSTYLSTIALFCGISCTILMLRFKGFKASLNLTTGKANGKHYEVAPQVSVVGAYRTSKEEYFGNINYLDSRKKITPSMVKLPPTVHTQSTGNIKPSKSTGDLLAANFQTVPAEVRKSTPNVSVQNAAQEGRQLKNQLKEQKKLEKERLAEQKKREKLATQEREKQEKLRKEREKQAAQQQAKEAKGREKQRKDKDTAPKPKQQATTSQQKNVTQQKQKNTQPRAIPAQKNVAPPPPSQIVYQPVQSNTNPLSRPPAAQYSTNTLESSISRSSGPPPYSDSVQIVPNKSDSTGNTSFGKSSDESSSWDLISQHRQQVTRAGPTATNTKQKHLDLRYNVGNVTKENTDNSEA